MNARKTVVVEVGRHSALLSGPMGAIHMALQITKTPWMKCVREPSKISVPITHLDDVLASLEYGQQRNIDMRDATW